MQEGDCKMGELRGRKERKEWEAGQRRERIVANAVKLFGKKDIDQITLEEIAKLSGYTVQNLYLYFRDKEDLFAAVLLKGLNNLLSTALKAVMAEELGIDKVLAYGEQFVNFSMKNTRYFDLYLRFEREYYVYHKHPVRRYHGDYLVQCQKLMDRISDLVIDAIRKGLEDGSIVSDLDPRHIMLFLWAQSLGVVQVATMRRKYFSKTYDVTMDTFMSEFRSSVRSYLSGR